MSTRLAASVACSALALGVAGLCSPASAHDRQPYPDIYPHTYPPPLHEVYARPENVSVQILTEGRPTTIYRDASYHWIEGRRGQRFAFRITNHNPFPIGVIPSADGHSLTADGRASARHPAYLIYPYGSATISIWREDLRGGRELVFTDVDQSLAAVKGDHRNIGVLGVLVWQLEDRHPPVPLDRYPERSGALKAPRAPSAGAPSAGAPSAGEAAKSRAGAARQYREDDGIGVGYGERTTDRAYITDRYRRVRVLGTVSIYYDDRPGLLRAGVDLNQYWRPYPQPYPDRRDADPFPAGGYHG
ncbi:MAG: hypothetical protein M3347_17585, partial [Armatimonadota bacterium]|nr:hypothetical protein [Armatimonadota bacterium]